MKKFILIGFLYIFQLSGEAQNPKWLVGEWLGYTFPSHDETSMLSKLKLQVKSTFSKTVLMYVDKGVYEKWRLESINEQTLTYKRKLSDYEFYNAYQMTITPLDNDNIIIGFFIYNNGRIEYTSGAKLKRG